MPAKPRPHSTSLSLVLDTSDLVLTTLKDAASFAPVPYLRDAAELALGIVNVIQGAKDNKDAFRRLAKDVCELTYAVLCAYVKADGRSKDFSDNAEELLGTLHSIERFARKKVTKGKVSRMVNYKSDLGKIQEYRETLRQCLDLFGLKSNITIQGDLARLVSHQEELLKIVREQGHSSQGLQSERRTLHEADSASPYQSAPRGSPRPNAFQPRSPFPHIRSPQGKFSMTSIGGDQNFVNAARHITNTNSGNTRTTRITDSNNNSSAKFYRPGQSKAYQI